MSPKSIGITLIVVLLLISSCNKEDDSTQIRERNFSMGFTTWPFGPNVEDVDDTYTFIESNADIYAEHIDNRIPWNSWINDDPLPLEFFIEISRKANKRLADRQLLLSVGLFNLKRDELAEDFDGTVPAYGNLDDVHIEDAYFEHINYLVTEFQPNYLVIAIEVNEFWLRSENKWPAYKRLIEKVTMRIKDRYPTLSVSESVSLHNLYEPNMSNRESYINEIIGHVNQMDFAAISFYPFLNNLNSQSEFQRTLDFLHERINIPIAFVETSHIAEDLLIPNLDLLVASDEAEQNDYLETLISNAQDEHYEFLIWWAHRDFDPLWETFPEDLKDLGRLWRDSGLIDENGNRRQSLLTWEGYFRQ